MRKKPIYIALIFVGILGILVVISLIFPFLELKNITGKFLGAGTDNQNEFFSCQLELFNRIKIAKQELSSAESIDILEFGSFKSFNDAARYIKTFELENEETVIKNLYEKVPKQKNIPIIIVQQKNNYFVVRNYSTNTTTPLYSILYVNSCDGKKLVILN